MGLFDAPTGGVSTNLTSGSPAYQDAIMQNTQRLLQPAYTNALHGTQQSFSDSGQLGGGLNKAAELGLDQSYLGKIGDAATNAATQGADLAEQNRQREEQRGWQVQDRDLNLNYLKDQANRQQDMSNQQQWAHLIGQGAGAVGAVGGAMLAGPPGAAAGAKIGEGVGGGLGSLVTPKTASNPYGLSLH